MKEQETLNQEALQQEELEELEVKNKFLGRDCFVTKIFSEIKDLAAIVTEQSGVSFSLRLKKKQILGAVENLDAQVLIVKTLLRDSIKNSSGQMEIDISQVWKKSNPKFTSIEIEIEWVRLMAIGRLVEYEDIVAVQKRKQYVSLAAVEAEVVALRNAISLSQRKSGRYCSVVNWLNTNANDSSNWSAMEGIKIHALRMGRLISRSLCHLFFGIPKNEQITERFVSFFNQLEAVSGQENNDMVVSARMIRLYKLAC
ncbi:Hypothetical predicted protein [Prunus dulcis]|uniref:Uncharacterized protein n=1 Tax=Prunus dulcis TaxID=3755 RepID=A0A5E4ECI2_PRUDU|nr:hypothetical protein L3X38_015216 [Prunus dulcis]VVA11468.1 Hypothetical predicted protein [Prunus dulcis]